MYSNYTTHVDQLLELMRIADEEITGYLYFALVPHAASVPLEGLKYTGTRVSGRKDIDDAVNKHPNRVMISIRKMVEYHTEGHYVKIPSVADSTKIYDSISKYLKVWKLYAEYVVNKSDDNVEFLLALDAMACYMYPQLVHTFAPVVVRSETMNKLVADKDATSATLFKSGAVNMFRSNTGTESGKKNNEPLKDVVIDNLKNTPSRQSMSDFIIDNYGK